jgi:hypothetical protein
MGAWQFYPLFDPGTSVCGSTPSSGGCQKTAGRVVFGRGYADTGRLFGARGSKWFETMTAQLDFRIGARETKDYPDCFGAGEDEYASFGYRQRRSPR